ncbi:TetR/AcrR family transcriptional regulator [Nocardia sp. NPDC058519]|uniref:TetR/AcrR family transcriptional regulator n=1 Tax=Nocardia sp. NPDC058519 TaxID=3346535 RepID=UPI0036636D64
MSAIARRGRGRPVRMSRDVVIATAERILRTAGHAGFSMRGLADELGISTAAIYHHFPTKAALFTAVLSVRAEELRRPELPEAPRERIVAIVDYLIETLHDMPWVIDVLVAGESFGRAAMWILDEFVGAAVESGMSDEYAGYMYGVAWRFVVGELMMRRAEAERVAAEKNGDPRPRWTDDVSDELAEYPVVVRMMPKWDAIRVDYDSAAAVAALIDGLLVAGAEFRGAE